MYHLFIHIVECRGAVGVAIPIVTMEFHHYFLIPNFIVSIIYKSHFLLHCLRAVLYIGLITMVFYPVHGFDGLFVYRPVSLWRYDTDIFFLQEHLQKHQVAGRSYRNAAGKWIDTFLVISRCHLHKNMSEFVFAKYPPPIWQDGIRTYS